MLDHATLLAMAERLAAMPGIMAVALGGSRARGDHVRTSDVDLGLYYRDSPDLDALRSYATELGNDPASVKSPGEWGPWVDGGAWLRVGDVPVDWIYRDASRVTASVAAAIAGDTRRYPQVGHPFGFPAHAYAAEVAVSIPLADPEGLLADLRGRLTTYPQALRAALIDDLWVAEFHLAAARKGAVRSDSVYVAACVSDALLIAAHAVHGRAGRWATNEKGLVAAAGGCPQAPPRLAERCEEAIASVRPGRLDDAIALAAAIVADVRAVASGRVASGKTP